MRERLAVSASQNAPGIGGISIDDTTHWLQGRGLGGRAHAFAAPDIGLDVLGSLSDGDVKGLGAAMLGQRERLIRAIGDFNHSTAFTSPLPTQAPVAAECRQPTVMLCDLVRSTALSSRFDLKGRSANDTSEQCAQRTRR